jgi:hypothetical protein
MGINGLPGVIKNKKVLYISNSNIIPALLNKIPKDSKDVTDTETIVIVDICSAFYNDISMEYTKVNQD